MTDSIFRKDGTAQGVAKQRMIESLAKERKRVIFDPYAEKFVLGSSVIKVMGHRFCVWLTKKLSPGFHEHLIARTRFIDDLVEKTTAKGAIQYVILGAGYDTRAHRLKLPPNIEIFEVDQPEVQRQKQAKLPENIRNAEKVTYVGVDFNKQTLKEQLLGAGFDVTKETIFTLEGVSQYIPKSAIAKTLQEVIELSKNVSVTFFISYVDIVLRQNPKACFGEGYVNPVKKAALIQDLAAKVGEPWISLFTAKEVKDLFGKYGFSVTENKTLADLNAEYFTPVGRTIPEREIFKLEHFVVAKRFVNNV
ncbi:class I SAM-dependent methyltransferase [Tenacibaculum sp. SG-28]|uniref:class I SAM-dependent methyltransferase n=1 Tax=Tenacibaculum sp. SG-28 TaxID=754426 RepID=UPI000CF46D4C|nr:class I SAM-dependent methyltransferase [Tenacibaculum sp. SG-28]PQJ23413.1 hypothetical protein BSU00_04305 [Tenacibaculum sp. SG-28]